MKATLNKIFSILLAVCFVLSAIPAPAAAAEIPTSSTTNGYYNGNDWVEGGNGSTTHTIDGTEVTLSKTATPVAGMENTFDITLQVKTSTTTSVETASGAVVLVIDTSGSMAYCSECGTDFIHNPRCPYFISSFWGNDVTRLDAAQDAAYTFLQTYAGTDANASRMLAIVSFASGSEIKLNWVNVAGGAGKNSFDAAVNAIYGLRANGGTNLDAGLKKAHDLMQQSAVAGYESKSVVALTDGAPTQSLTAGNGTSGSDTINTHTKAQAGNVKSLATLYTIGFGVANQTTHSGGPTVNKFLTDIASPKKAYTAENRSELFGVFAAITQDITSGLTGEGWTATDPMADMITVTGGTGANFSGVDGTYTWKLSNPETVTEGSTTKYVYSYTYRVTLNVQGESFEEGKFFPTNEPTYLNVGDAKYPFPVPGVTGVLPRTDVTVTKVWDDAQNQDGIRADSVTVRLTEDGKAISEDVVLNTDNNWTYTWYGLIAKSKGNFHNYSVEENAVSGYTASATNSSEGDFNLIVTNTHEPEKTAVKVTKTWNDNGNQDGIRPSEITVNLMRGNTVAATGIMTAANGWEIEFTGLDKYENGGKEITYTAQEAVVPEGYTSEATGLTITNTLTPQVVSKTVTKVWDDTDNQDGIRPGSITVQLMNGTTVVGTAELNAANKWQHEFKNLPKNSGGKEIEYTVQEVNVPAGYKANVDGLTITNTHEVAKTDITVNKYWEDNNNQDGIRPTEIQVQLYANGKAVNQPVTIKGNRTDRIWSYTFRNLDLNANGKPVEYTVKEVNVPAGYETKADGLDITNSYTPTTIDISGSKTWDDNNNQDGIRPTSITIHLEADDKVIDTKTVTSEDGWKWSFTGLPKYRDHGIEIEYSITEESVSGYTTQVDGYNVKNTHTPETIPETVMTKVWNDNHNQDGKRPESIEVQLYANGVAQGEPVSVSGSRTEDTWTYIFKDLAKYANGQIITYTVKEVEVPEFYTSDAKGMTITNTHKLETTSISGTKIWDDDNNRDNIRPKSITVNLMADGVKVDSAEVTAQDDWKYEFTGLTKYRAGKVGEEIVYTVEEEQVEGYDPIYSENNHDITNKHDLITVTISGTKIWEDNNNQDGVRPEKITVNLMDGEKKVATIEVMPNEKGEWTFEFAPQFKYREGKFGEEINYTVQEEAVAGYEPSYNGFIITNTHEVAKTSVQVTKVWDDSENQDGKRPQSVDFVLWANDKETDMTLTLTESVNWTDSFKNLDKFEKGVEIKYDVKEVPVAVEGYELKEKSGNMTDGFTFTNSYTPETIDITGTKTWNDAENQDGKRPASITINLTQNGKVIATQKVTADSNWTWTFENLPKYENKGQLVPYGITEEKVEGYTTVVNGYNVTNSYTPEETYVKVTKVWVDDSNRDNIRPNDITVKLLANDKDTKKTLTLSEGNNWADTFTGLPKYAEGKEITYTIQEVEVKGYTIRITGNAQDGFTVENTHAIETVNISGTKTWNDKKNQDGKRPESITIDLKANGRTIQTLEVSADAKGDWTYEVKGLPKFESGKPIEYTVTEHEVEGYSAEYDGFDITNKYTPEIINIQVTKAWADANDQDGIRPESVTVTLIANGEETKQTLKLTAKDQWTGSFEKLDKYAEGKEIVYTLKETDVEGYTSVISGDHKNGFTVTNTHEPETIKIVGKKTWNDANNQDGKRPQFITVSLKANGKAVDTKIVTAENNWIYSFENLAKYENGGNEIVYTVEEAAVAGYTAKYDGYNITNTYSPETINIKVTKSWVDSNDADGIRPEKVTIYLYADGKDTGAKLVLSAKGKWTGSFTDLPKYHDGKLIEYTLKEKDVKGYNAVIKGSANDGFTVTNSHNYIPKTGDERTPILWGSMMAIGVLAMVFAGNSFFKTNNKKRRRAR